MKLKKFLFLSLIIFACFGFIIDADAVEDVITGSNGDGLDTSASSGNCSLEGGCWHDGYLGVRVTLVDDNGKMIAGTHYEDFWSTLPINARGKNNSQPRSIYINLPGGNASSESWTDVGQYVIGNVTSDLSLIGGSISYSNQHELIENQLKSEFESYKKSKNCGDFKLFNKLGYDDFCSTVLQNSECDEKLAKIYILVEPLYYVNYKKNNVVLTGTELAAMIYKTRILNVDNKSTYNLNRAAFDNALVNMYLTGKDADYDFKSNKKKYNKFDAYASDFAGDGVNIYNYYYDGYKKIIYKNVYNNDGTLAYNEDGTVKMEPDYFNSPKISVSQAIAREVLRASVGLPSSLSPLGNSMHLVWLKSTLPPEVCEPKCCIPCSIDRTNPNCDKNECCFDEETLISTDGTPDACIPWEEYWDSHDDEHNPDKVCYPEIIIPPIPSNPDGCPTPEIKPPTATIEVCDDTTDTKKSTFTDGYYNSDFKDLFLLEKLGGQGYYVPEVKNNYCTKFCQQHVEITLPNNYPTTNAGRFFIWKIKDSENNEFVKEVIKQKCVTDIDLDSWYNDYFEIVSSINGALANVEVTLKDGFDINCSAVYSAKNDDFNAYGKIAKNKYDACMLIAANGNPELGGKPTDPETLELLNYYFGINQVMKENSGFGSCPWGEFTCVGQNATSGWDDGEWNKYLAQLNCEIIVDNACDTLGTICGGLGGELLCDKNNLSNASCNNPDPKKSSLQYKINELIACQPELEEGYLDSIKTELINKSQLEITMGYETFLDNYEFKNTDFDIQGEITDFSETHMCIEESNDPCAKGIFSSSICHLENKFVPMNIIVDTQRINTNIDGCAIYWYNNNGKTNYFKFMDGQFTPWNDMGTYWNSYLVTEKTINIDYSLKDNINTCICKDGTIMNASDDGSCNCLVPEPVYEVVADISTKNYCYFEWKAYTVLPDGGNFSVEYMNPSGFYPLLLKYSHIGIDGSFSKFILANQFNTDESVSDYCSKEDGGSCYYSDEDDICRYSIKNDILNDGGYIEDAKCPEGECPPTNICGVGECSGSGENPKIAGMELVYRVIDLDTPFPGSNATGENSSRVPGANWLGTEDSGDYINRITNNRGVEGSKLYNSDLDPLYEFTINPAIIKKIRALNAANRDYASLSTMAFDEATVEGGISYVLRGDIKNIIETNGGYFSINLDGDERFDLINNNSAIDSSGNLVCRGVSR